LTDQFQSRQIDSKCALRFEGSAQELEVEEEEAGSQGNLEQETSRASGLL